MKMRLDLFTGISVTCYKDGHMTTFSASPNSSVAKDAEVTLTVTPASGYEVDEIEVLQGGVTIANNKFAAGETDVVLYCKSKKSTLYMVTEECSTCVNDTKVVLHKNTVVELTPNGVPKGVTVENGGADLTVTAAMQELIAQGILVKI